MFPRGAAISERCVSPGAVTHPGVRGCMCSGFSTLCVCLRSKRALRPIRSAGDISQGRVLPGPLSWTVVFQASDSPDGGGHHNTTPAALSTLSPPARCSLKCVLQRGQQVRIHQAAWAPPGLSGLGTVLCLLPLPSAPSSPSSQCPTCPLAAPWPVTVQQTDSLIHSFPHSFTHPGSLCVQCLWVSSGTAALPPHPDIP